MSKPRQLTLTGIRDIEHFTDAEIVQFLDETLHQQLRGKDMRPLSRKPVNKQASAGQFRRNAGTTKRANVAPPPNRGGYRF